MMGGSTEDSISIGVVNEAKMIYLVVLEKINKNVSGC